MTDPKIALPRAGNRVPLWLKLAYTTFMALLVPVYWHYYGPTNFLYFCDVALLITLVGIWIEKSVSRLAVRGGNPGTGSALGRRLSFHPRRIFPDRRNQLHVQPRQPIVPARVVIVSRLVAISAGLSSSGVRIR